MLRAILWTVLIAFGVGFLIGTLLRRELERPIRYIGGVDPEGTVIEREAGRASAPSNLAANPRDVFDALPGVFVSRDHEEQV